MIRLGIDTGGTFTDLIAFDDETGRISTVKVPSTPSAPADAPLAAIKRVGGTTKDIERIVLGTTIATNARLQKKGATVLYIGTKGVEDVPIIGRIDRREAYNPAWPKPDTGVKRRHTYGIPERVDHKGTVVHELEPASLVAMGDWIEKWVASDPNNDWGIAVNLLFSYVNPAHEKSIGTYIKERFPAVPVSLSHEVSPIWREYERATTTITDAFIKHIIGRFVDGLNSALSEMAIDAPLALMKSNGGHVQSATAADVPVQLLLSGLAGGVIAGRRFARDHTNGNAVTLDMGGTSCDVGLIANGEFGSTSEYEIEWGVPVSSLFIDYTTIGAGGGSIAYVDSGGLLCVGPRSAGAEPGPACYGKGGTEPTVTDANVVLGRLDPNFFLGGEVSLDAAAADTAIAGLGEQLGLAPEQTALAMLATAAENRADTIRLMTVDRGIDHREFGLIAFGGAGPLHAVDVARHLGMQHVVVPPSPGLLSALGTLLTELRVDRARTVMHRSDLVDLDQLNQQLRELVDESIAELKRDGLDGEATVTGYLSMRYLGQNFGELVALDVLNLDDTSFERALNRLHEQHEALYGYAFRDKAVEITEVRVIGLGGDAADISLAPATSGSAEPKATRKIFYAGGEQLDTPVYQRETLPTGTQLTGPALIEETDSTTLVPRGGTVAVQSDGSLLLDVSSVVDQADNTTSKNAADDPVTLTVVNNALKNICDEMASAMIRTSHSPIFSESRDFSCILFDRKLRMVGQAEMNPAIICAGLHTIPLCVQELGEDSFEPGDVIVHNDPYRGQCHMPEHMFMKPVFIGDELIAYAANIAHIGEIGGMAVGSFASTATEIFQEGLRLPPVKIMARGEYVKDVWRIIMTNHRTPDTTWGDFHALLASLTTAERRLQDLVGRLGVDKFEDIADRLIDHAERWMRSEIAKLPNGVYEFEDYFEDDGVEAKPYYFRSKVHIRDDDIVVDLSNSDPQARGPINVSYVATAAAGSTAVLQAIGARDVPLNSGCFKPIKVVAPPGTVANPVFPAPCVAGNTEGQPRIISAVQGALAKAIPDRIGAAEGGTACNILFGGTHPDTGDYYTHYQLDGGGWGGRMGMDGNSAQCIAHGSTIRATPIEVFETRYPMRTVEYSLRADSGGAGKWRGGVGVRRLFEVTAPEITVSALLDRTDVGPWGFRGGQTGGPAGLFVRFAGTDEFKTFVEAFGTVSPTKFVNIRMMLGDQLLMLSPGGGGYGEPAERDDAMLKEDLLDGFVTNNGLGDYGVREIDASG